MLIGFSLIFSFHVNLHVMMFHAFLPFWCLITENLMWLQIICPDVTNSCNSCYSTQDTTNGAFFSKNVNNIEKHRFVLSWFETLFKHWMRMMFSTSLKKFQTNVKIVKRGYFLYWEKISNSSLVDYKTTSNCWKYTLKSGFRYKPRLWF